MTDLRNKLSDPRIRWTIAGLIFLLLRILSSWTPDFVEAVYSNGVFVFFRFILRYTFGLLPVPGFLVLFSVGLVFVVRYLKRRKRSDGLGSGIRKTQIFLNVLATLSIIWIFYLSLWGFNYARPSFLARTELAKFVPDTINVRYEIRSLLPDLMESRMTVRKQTREDTAAISFEELPADLSVILNESMKKFMEANAYSPSGNVRIRRVAPDGVMLRLGISGIYFPFTGEGHVDASLSPCNMPFTMAHEMAHGFGVTSESEANALAYFACIESEIPVLDYVAKLNHYRYLAGGFYAIDSAGYRAFADSLPNGIQNDLKSIKNNRLKYPTIFPSLSEGINDLFLRFQGIKEGTRSYGKFVLILKAWSLREKSNQS